MSTVDQTGFFQQAPELHDEWRGDAALRGLLDRVLPADVLADVTPSLAEMGQLAAGELDRLSRRMNRRRNEPELVRFDPWGRRIDEIRTAPAWDRIGEIAASRGVVATGYADRNGRWDRVHQFGLAYLFNPSSALYSCPLAMTDGAVKTLLVHADEELVQRAVPRLTSRDPERMWTSGQWMTERAGGSDAGRAETTAVKDGDAWRLTGTKWFTSAVTSEVALALARPEGNPDGGRGLAVFYVELRDEAGRLDGIRVLRLKDKLGTRQMATAELALEGTPARLVGEPANGTRTIAPMLTVTRLWNTVTAAAGMRRALALARDYARRRTAFGRRLIDQPLHQATLAGVRAEHEAALQVAFRAVELLGLEETGGADEEQRRLRRILVPLAKLVTGRQAIAVASEALECFGGAGYIEDTDLPVLLRDAQVLPIWEGTTNVLALDALRALRREEALDPLVAEIRRASGTAEDARIGPVAERATAAAEHAAAWIRGTAAGDHRDAVEHGARRWATTLGRAAQAALLCEQAQADLDAGRTDETVAVARRFAAGGLDELAGAIDPAEDARLARGSEGPEASAGPG